MIHEAIDSSVDLRTTSLECGGTENDINIVGSGEAKGKFNNGSYLIERPHIQCIHIPHDKTRLISPQNTVENICRLWRSVYVW